MPACWAGPFGQVISCVPGVIGCVSSVEILVALQLRVSAGFKHFY